MNNSAYQHKVASYDELGRRTFVTVRSNDEICSNDECKAHNKIIVDHHRGDRICTECGVVQRGAVFDNSATNSDYDSSTYRTRDLPGKSRALRSSARDKESNRSAKHTISVTSHTQSRRAALPRELQHKFYKDSKAGMYNIQERASMKNPAFLERANASLTHVLSWEFFGVHIHNTADYIERAEKAKSLSFSFEKTTLQRIFMFARQIPEAAWAIHDRAMGAPYMAGAGIYLACLHYDIPMRISHIASCIFSTHSNTRKIFRIERKITACVERMTATGFFTELKITYEHGVIYSIRSMLKFPDVPRALKVTPRLRPGADGKLVRGKPSLTKMQAALVGMSYEQRRELMPRPCPELHQDFVKECISMWNTFVRCSNQDVRLAKLQAIRDRVIKGAVSQKTVDHKRDVEAHRFMGGCRRTKKIPGINQGNFTANVERMAVAVIMSVALRRGAPKRYGRIFWPHFNFKICQPNRLKKKIVETLTRHEMAMVGAIRDAPPPHAYRKRKRVMHAPLTAVEAAARAASDAIAHVAGQTRISFPPLRVSLHQLIKQSNRDGCVQKRQRLKGVLM